MYPISLTIFVVMFGRFADYLLKVKKVKKCQTALSYLSKTKCFLELQNPNIQIFLNSRWYTKLRNEVSKVYFDLAIATGTSMVESAPTMTDADLDFLLKVLIMKNTPASLADRCMFTFQWQAIGRNTRCK